MRRDFPAPAGPRIVTNWQLLSPAARSNAWRSIASSRSRPTSGESSRRATAGAPETTPSTRQASIASALPLSSSGSTRLDENCVLDEAVGRIADQDLARARSRLEPCSHVHRVARDEGLPRRRVTGHDRPGVDAGANAEVDSPALLELAVQLAERGSHLGRGPHRSQWVVLVHRRRAEDRHHRVPDELLDRAAVALDHRPHIGEEAVHHPACGFRVQALARAAWSP